MGNGVEDLAGGRSGGLLPLQGDGSGGDGRAEFTREEPDGGGLRAIGSGGGAGGGGAAGGYGDEFGGVNNGGGEGGSRDGRQGGAGEVRRQGSR